MTNHSSIKRTSSACDGLKLYYELILHDCADGRKYSLFASAEDQHSAYYTEKLLDNVTTSFDTADRIFDLVSKGSVTPMTLTEVVEDILADI